jgi:hypothetical protein
MTGRCTKHVIPTFAFRMSPSSSPSQSPPYWVIVPEKEWDTRKRGFGKCRLLVNSQPTNRCNKNPVYYELDMRRPMANKT